MQRKRKKALEAPREPRRPKTHWDHVLEEMIWLSKDFESERKWKLAQAKKVALRASKGMLDQATREEKKLKEGEQRLRKVALNISKDVKKFWIKIEKLVLYKHQMELDEKKKRALDKQLEFLLGQTERYSTMLAENLVDKPLQQYSVVDQQDIPYEERQKNDTKEPAQLSSVVPEPQSDSGDNDNDYDVQSDESEDDEHTIEEDEALITEEERQEELAALHNEVDIPVEELLKRYALERVSGENTPEKKNNGANLTVEGGDHAERRKDHSAVDDPEMNSLPVNTGRRCDEVNGDLAMPENHLSEIETGETRNQSNVTGDLNKDLLHDSYEEQEDGDFVLANGEEKDDETTLSEEEELAKADPNNTIDEIQLLQKESEIPLEELLARYKKEFSNDEVSEDESEYTPALSDNLLDSPEHKDVELKQQDVSMNEIVEPGELLLVEHHLVNEREAGNEKIAEEGHESENRIADAAAAARSAQPTGNTFSTTKVRTKFPFLLKYPLREYQHIGLDWLVTMYEKRLNGILADEMGLGKTIMTIALLAHLACEKGIWGPHLIVVPTSVMLNWETEFLKWCPAFKILTYFGSAKERKLKRQGWLKPNSFHVCITTYRLVIQDSKVFKRKKWKYLILDEAHLIKNWKSQRWQTLLNFNSKRRILLTGTPLQNDLMELWSLMHFLMPHIFQSHQEFKDWFSNPISGMVEGQEKVNKEVVDRLHNVLRPFLLRRLKRDVEKQLPMKHEHVIYCRLSKRQRNLYEDFIASSETQATLASANFFGMISIIMQLRKVCNHPDLFEGRPIISSFDMAGIDIQLNSSVCSLLSPDPFSTVDLYGLGLLFTHLDFSMTSWECDEVNAITTPSRLIKERANLDNLEEIGFQHKQRKKSPETSFFEEIRKAVLEERLKEVKERAASIAWWNSLRCRKKPIYSTTFRELVTIKNQVDDIHRQKVDQLSCLYSSKLADVILSPVEHFQKMINLIESFMFAIPAARAPVPICWCSKTGSSVFLHPTYKEKCSEMLLPLLSPIRPAIVRRQVYFPDRRLIQFDCGKLQELAVLLRQLKSEGHRALIFTQMTKMLDILEAFINLYGYTYMRLDGSTQPEERQTLMQRFNTNPKIFLFILSTRSGGVGINLFGADTVIFYDSDWNPAMDQQAQDRCHRIGQTREVHIYRLISESTIEENILKKANQKRALDDLVIQSGGYNTEFFKKLDPMELFSGHKALPLKNVQKEKNHSHANEVSVSNADVEAALKWLQQQQLGQAILTLENQLRPIDRYAIRFLELWDPIIDKAAMESEVRFEEEDWELDRIEKYKEEMEAEIDDDEEPLLYERWDADFATEAYRQQVEALAQHQLMEELEAEANEKEDADDGYCDTMMNETPSNTKPKSKKKPKKAKFKSLKKGSLTSELKHVKEEPSIETMSMDDDVIYHEEAAYSDMTSQYPDLDSSLSGKQQDDSVELKPCENMVADLEQKQAGRSKMGGRISITAMPVKRVLMIKPEKLKKGMFGQEIVFHLLILGCHRKMQYYVLLCMNTVHNGACEKTSSAGSGKALLKVTEDNIQMLLNVAAEQPDHELLLQRHFTALLSSVWRMTRVDRQQNLSSSRNGLYFGGKFFSSFNQISWNSVKEPAKRMKFTTSAQSCKLLAAALHEFNSRPLDDTVSISNRIEDAPCISEQLEVTLEFEKEEGDSLIPFPPVINLMIPITDPLRFRNKDVGEHNLKAFTMWLRVDSSKASCYHETSPCIYEINTGIGFLEVANEAAYFLRDAARACFEGSLGWASSAFPANDVKLRTASKPQSLGKHKLSVSDSKPPRSKLKKTSERGEMHNLFAEPALQPLLTVSPRDPNLRFDLAPAVIQDGWTNDRDSCSISFLDEELPGELGSFEAMPHDYVPGLISGLDDCSLLPEYTDIG
ncbi:hypothetical protein GH714_027718 [Hevea brasiliensis]|uniref:DNA helicase n=1 Tax=Hevea brasiliensis TaxID=3981 RepID=A0A6A6MQX2_HEVBR|nr:hypothetical protein GH714_027718 [Hevea brasiliensis]